MMGALIDYWYYTGDSEYNDLVTQGLLFQVGDNNDYMPLNQTLTEGNDDQGFWGLSVMTAAEYNFPDPPPDKPQWLGLAQAVFNTQAARWEPGHCNGGLRWQIFTWNNGFDYKNSISQACFFALGARLALYTGNQTYAEWATKTWDWMIEVQFIDTKTWAIYDGAHIEDNCTQITEYQFSYNAAGFMLGVAAMYNMTGDQVWKTRLDNLLGGAKVFFTGPNSDIMTEVACESVERCDLDEQSFKAYMSRWFAAITKWAPHTYDVVMPLIRASAIAAAEQCTGGQNGRMCGLRWNQNGTWDGTMGVGQQMSAMEVTLACMIADQHTPVTAHTGGTSQGNPDAGGSDIGRTTPNDPNDYAITAGDRAGAAILTVLFVGGWIAGLIWIFLDETSDKGVLMQLKGFKRSIIALATGGAAAGVLRKKQKDGSEEVNEKQKGPATAPDGVMGWPLANDQAADSEFPQLPQPPYIPRPLSVISVRAEGESRRSRRLSNMPIGWPYNPSVRGSIYNPSVRGSTYNLSTKGSFLTEPEPRPDSPRGSFDESVPRRSGETDLTTRRSMMLAEAPPVPTLPKSESPESEPAESEPLGPELHESEPHESQLPESVSHEPQLPETELPESESLETRLPGPEPRESTVSKTAATDDE